MTMFILPEVMEIKKPDNSGWNLTIPQIKNEEEKKIEFGIELAKHPAFKAACNVFGNDTNIALWISQKWANDPVVIATRDKYKAAVEDQAEALDKEKLAAKVLKFVDEKNPSNTFYIADAKDRLAALKLYAEIKGFLKDNSPAGNTTIFNSMKITLVKAKSAVEPAVIDNEPIKNSNSPLKLKVVSAT